MPRCTPVMVCWVIAVGRRGRQAGWRSRPRSRRRTRRSRLPAQRRRDDPGVLQRLPGQLQHQPLLRVHGGGLARGDAEEARRRSRRRGRGSRRRRALRRCSRASGRRAPGDGVAAVRQQPPERGRVGRAGQSARDTHNGDAVKFRISIGECYWLFMTIRGPHSSTRPDGAFGSDGNERQRRPDTPKRSSAPRGKAIGRDPYSLDRPPIRIAAHFLTARST